jgi:hypothetical protein
MERADGFPDDLSCSFSKTPDHFIVTHNDQIEGLAAAKRERSLES